MPTEQEANASQSRLRSPAFVPTWVALLLAGVLVLGLLWLSATLSRQSALDRLQKQSSESLEVYATALANEIDQNRAMPQVLAEYPLFAQLLNNPDNPELLDTTNRQLATFNRLSGTLTTYLLDTTGMTVASSNWDAEDSFVGEDLSFRPYFKVAVRDGTAAYFALGTTSGKRGYYFSSAVRFDGYITGVIVIKLDLATLEQSWEQSGDLVLVTDQDGVVFISSRPDWLYRGLYPMSTEVLDRIDESRRYPNRVITPLQVESREALNTNKHTLKITDKESSGQRSYLRLSRTMPEKAWTLHVLADDYVVDQSVNHALLIGALLALLGIAAAQLAGNRRAARLQRLQIEKDAYAQLESLVEQRTTELTSEITERKQVEADLRETRSTLVQASKMAALGQMATGINHELNQPLSAIRSFAENATTLLQRNDTNEVNSNLNLIVRLTERMDGIMKHLKLFARKAQPELASVPIQDTLNETLEVLAPAIRKHGITIHSDLATPTCWVVAESNRLQQVFTNLIQNAIDAMQESPRREITLGLEETRAGQFLEITVADTGSGISSDIQTRLFEPFFTTKSADAGLGLGLSITAGIIKDFGGTIELLATGDAGSTFRITLRVAQEAEASAA